MELGLKDKVALVTGGGQGIGRAIAQALAAEGCAVVVAGRRKAPLEETVAAVSDAGGTALAIAADVESAADVTRLVDETVSRFGTLHILVNNAGGIPKPGAFDDLNDEDWEKTWGLNVLSAVRTIRAALPFMRAQRWGRIINIASENGVQPDRVYPDYGSAKAALINLTKSLSRELGRDGILVNAVSPGIIRTPGVVSGWEEDAAARGITFEESETQFMKKRRPTVVLGRAGWAEEPAALVVFLASELASFITGVNYLVDGGSVGRP